MRGVASRGPFRLFRRRPRGDAGRVDARSRGADAFKPKADPAPPKLRRQRKPSIRALIAAAEKTGKTVTSVTMPDGTVLQFGEAAPAEASNPWLADLAKVTKQ